MQNIQTLFRKILQVKTVLFALIITLTMSTVTFAQTLSIGDFLTQYFNHIGSNIPESYQYITLDEAFIQHTKPETVQALQKAIYLGLLTPKSISALPLANNISESNIAHLIEKIQDINI